MGLSLKKHQVLSLLPFCLLFLSPTSSQSKIIPEKVHTILSGTSESNSPFWQEGLFTGGDRSMNETVIKNIRYSVHPQHERMVIELNTTQNGEIAAIPRPPYYQFVLDPRLSRLTLTFWGDPKLHFDPKKLHQLLRKSSLISSLNLLPKLEDELWSFGLSMKNRVEIKVFELDSPVRIIIDIRAVKG
jgi:hypothetical protein